MTRRRGSGGGRTRTDPRPRRTTVVSCKAVLAVVAFGVCCVDVAHGFSSAISCPLDVFSCIGDDECSSCLELLGDSGLTLGGVEFELCSELYAGMCVTADSIGCNVENEELVDLFACAVDEEFGCDDFTTCADATAGLVEATEAPASAPSTAPAIPTPAPSIARATDIPATTPVTAAPAIATPAPVAPTFPTPVFPLPTAAPTTGSRGNVLLPTAAPTAGGSAAFGTAFPSPAMFESSADTMAPSESSAAPTGVDGIRGGIGSAFSGAPTAAPTGFEGLDDLEDGTNGGDFARHTAGTAVAWCVVAAALSSALAALAV